MTTLTGVDAIDDVVLIDQTPIGRSPRSNPVTYIKAFDEIRRMFADDAARARSADTRAARSASTCRAAGARRARARATLEVEMVFMADVFVPCEICGGTRFKPEVLEVTVHGKNVAQTARAHGRPGDAVLPRGGAADVGALAAAARGARVSAARPARDDAVRRRGPANQDRARAGAAESRTQGRKLYIMDEPTTGLHLEDIRKLAEVLRPIGGTGTHGACSSSTISM